MHKRINITLPEQTVRLLDRVAPRGDRSRLIDTAVRSFVAKIGRSQLRRQLIEGYRQSAQKDLELAATWFPLEEAAWQKRQS